MSATWLFVMQCCFVLTYSCQSQVSAGRCRFHLENQSEDCSNFTLNHCEWDDCNSYLTQQIGSSIIMICGDRFTMTKKDWSGCLSSCCDSLNGNETYATLQDCRVSSQTNLIIPIKVLGGILIAVGAVLLIWLNRHEILHFCKAAQPDEMDSEETNIHLNGNHHQNILHYLPKSDSNVSSQWNDCSSEVIKQISEIDCGICLQSKPTVRLNCGHYFHRYCIAAWIGVRISCPLCKSSETSDLTVICSKCFMKSTHIQTFNKMIQNKAQFCSSCAT